MCKCDGKEEDYVTLDTQKVEGTTRELHEYVVEEQEKEENEDNVALGKYTAKETDNNS